MPLFLIVKLICATLYFHTENIEITLIKCFSSHHIEYDTSKLKLLTVENRNRNNGERSERVSMEVHIIYPLYSG